MKNALKTLTSIMAGLSLAVVAGVIVHVVTSGNDTLATVTAGIALIAAFISIRPATK